MPKRVIDFDALWASDKLASCAEWAQSEYAWLYGLADASGSFEITNLRVIWGRVAAIRKNLTLERLQQIFDEFIARGLLFTWEENGKRYGHWTGSDVPGRLPAPSWRARLEKLAPPVPREALVAYSARFGGSKEGIVARASARANSPPPVTSDMQACFLEPRLEEAQAELKHGLEGTQAQDWDLNLDLEKDLEKEVSSASQLLFTPQAPVVAGRCGARQPQHCTPERPNQRSTGLAPEHAPAESSEAGSTPDVLLEIYEEERGQLPPAGAMTTERRVRCERCLAAGLTAAEFRAAVRCAAGTPFLAGNGYRGWQASFDWLIANRHNVRKVLGGEYDPHLSGQPRNSGQVRASARAGAGKSRAERRGIADLYTGVGPRPADCGVRVNPAALERILARQTSLSVGSSPYRGRSDARQPSDAFSPVSEKGRDDHALFAPDHTTTPGQEGPGAREQPHALGTPEIELKPAAFDAHSRASPAPLKS